MSAGRTDASRCIGFAHRGASAEARENTLGAFALALRHGATGLESDVWQSADGVPVLDHDGVTPDGVAFRECARRALPSHVPALAELYAECGTAFELSLDVKDAAAAAAVVDVARAAGAADRLWLCHWNWRVLAPWRALDARVRLVDSTRAGVMRTAPDARAERMVALGIDAVNLHWSDWSALLVAPFRARGRRVLAWDAQDVEALRRMLALGVDGVFSDHVGRMMREIDASSAIAISTSSAATNAAPTTSSPRPPASAPSPHGKSD
jgi:glycerophosphoryl diester phosphodiesterase